MNNQYNFFKLSCNTWKEERKYILAFYTSLEKAINHFLFRDKYVISCDLNKTTEQLKAIYLVIKLLNT